MSGEEWATGPARRCPPDCVDGYRPVNELYAIGYADPETEPAKFAALLNTVYPCSTCRPQLSKLWAEGHLNADHLSAGGCEECRPRAKRRRP